VRSDWGREANEGKLLQVQTWKRRKFDNINVPLSHFTERAAKIRFCKRSS
jgi:hypothetical protein